MKTFNYCLLFYLILIGGAFKYKETSIFAYHGTNKNIDIPKVKTIRANGVTDSYTYGTDGMVTLISCSDSSKSIFQYINKMITERCFNAEGIDTTDITYYLNEKGLADSSLTYKKGVISYEKYWYDGKGYNTVEKDYDSKHQPVRSMYTAVSSGNAISECDTEYQLHDANRIGFLNVQMSFQYFTNCINTTDAPNKGQPWLGLTSVNTEKLYDFIYSDGSNTRNIYEYAYDPKGRTVAVKSTTTFAFPGYAPSIDTYSVTYTYY